MNKRKQNYGIKFPFTKENTKELFLDLNEDVIDKAKSDLFHVIFTPKGQRYRMPEFGTRLIDYIYSPSDTISWDEVKEEIRTAVEKYVPSVSLKDIVPFESEEDDHLIFVTVKFTVTDGVKTTDVIEASVKI